MVGILTLILKKIPVVWILTLSLSLEKNCSGNFDFEFEAKTNPCGWDFEFEGKKSLW